MNNQLANHFQNQFSSALVETESNRAIAETQSALVIAKRFPRDQVAALDRVLMACTRPRLAETALYSYARGGTDITGPSIRLAEAIAQAWGNVQFGIRELEQRNGESTVQAYAWDVETNTRREMTFQVPHVRHTRQGKKDLVDPRDIYEMVANQGARRLRACILGVIPGDVVEEAVHQCETTLHTKEDVTQERVAKMLEHFEGYGVTKEQIEARIQRRIDAITPALMVQLRKIYNSLKDGMSKPADWFEEITKPEKPKFEKASTSKAKSSAPEAAAPAPKATPREALANLMKASHIKEATLLSYIKAQTGEEHGSVSALDEQMTKHLINSWPDIVEHITQEGAK